MSWFKRVVEDTPAPPAPPNSLTVSSHPAPPDVSKYSVGEKLGELTRLGSLWVNFNDVSEINMCPIDGCGAEIFYRTGRVSHLNALGKALVQKYMDQQREGLSDLERMGGL